jgi:soluble lytic murein transglycosylase-like protein
MMGAFDLTQGVAPTPSPDEALATTANAFNLGRTMAMQPKIDAANAQYNTDPQGAIVAMRPLNPGRADEMQQTYQDGQDRQSSVDEATAIAGGNLPGAAAAAARRGATGDVTDIQAKILALPEEAKAKALSHMITVNNIAQSIAQRTADPNERARIAQHLAQTNPGLGIDPASLTPDQMTDDQIAALHGAVTDTAMRIKEQELAEKSKQDAFERNKPVYHFGQPGEVATLESGSPSGADPAAAGGGAAPGPGATPASSTAAGPAPSGANAGVQGMITGAAAKYGVDPKLALSVAQAESQFDQSQTSPKGAIGVMQLMPGTAQGLGVDPHDPAQNIDGGVRYLAQLSKQFHGDPRLIAAAYNAGPGAVTQHGGVPPYPETQAYVAKVTGGAGRAGAPAASAASGLPGLPTQVGQSTVIGGDPNGGLPVPGRSGPGIPITQIPASDQAVVQAYIDGRMPIPTGAALRSPQVLRYLQEAAAVAPSFDASDYPTRVALRKDFSAGAGSQAILQLNKVAGHLDVLSQKVDALHNGEIEPLNALTNLYALKTGNTAVSNFQNARDFVVEEVDKLFKGGAADVAGTRRAIDNLRDSSSPGQIRGAIATLAQLVREQMDAQQARYDNGMGTRAATFRTVTPLAAETLATLERLGGVQSRSGSPRPTAAAPPPARPAASHAGQGYTILGVEHGS